MTPDALRVLAFLRANPGEQYLLVVARLTGLLRVDARAALAELVAAGLALARVLPGELRLSVWWAA